jgi:hypothetical protein
MEDRQEYGRRLLPHIVDEVASESPDRIVYSIVDDPDDAHDIRHITASAFAKAIDKTAWWLNSLVGAQTSVLPIGYIGPRKSAIRDRDWSTNWLSLIQRKMIFDMFC